MKSIKELSKITNRLYKKMKKNMHPKFGYIDAWRNINSGYWK